MAQYRAIFKNANIAMLAAIAAAALAAGQAQAAPTTDWTALNGGTAINNTDTLTVSGDAAIVNQNGFNVTISSGDAHVIKGNTAHGIFTVADGKEGLITLKGSAKTDKLVVGGAAAANTAEVTITSFTNTKGTLEIQGEAADAGKFSALNAKTIKIGDDAATDGDAIVTVKGFGKLNATGTADGEGLIIAKGAAVSVAENGSITASNINMSAGTLTLGAANSSVSASKINLNGGKVTLSGAAATTFLGSETSDITIAGATVEDGTSTAGTVQGNNISLSSGKIIANQNLIIDAKGEFTASGGTIEITDQGTKKLTLKGVSNISGATIENNSGSLIIEGSATFADGTLKVDTKSGTTVLGSASAQDISTLNLSSKELANLMKGGLKSSGEGTGVLNISGEEEINLATTGGTAILQDTGALNAGLGVEGNATLKIKGVSGAFTKADELDGGDKKVVFAFDSFKLGSGDTVTMKSGAGVEVGKVLTVGSGAEKATLKVVKGGVTLNGAGSVAAKTINLEGSAAADAKLDVTNGAWEVKDLSLTKGQATVGKSGTLTVTGTLLAKDDSTLTVDGILSTEGAGKLNFKEAADNSLTLNAGSSLKLDADDILTGKTLNAEALKATALTGTGIVYINNETALTEQEFRAIKGSLSNFSGVFNMNVDIVVPDELTTDNVLPGLQTEDYNGKTLNVTEAGKNNITSGFSVGNVNVKVEEDLKLAAGGSMILNNASAENGAGNFVTKASGSGTTVGGVQFTDANNALTLVGEGKIGSITSDSTKKGVVVVGLADDAAKAGHVTVVAGNNIGASATDGVKEVVLNVGSSLTVESGSVFTDNLNMLEGTSAAVTGDITTGALQVLGNSLTANKLIINDAAAAADNTIAGGANVTLTELALGKNNALLVGEVGSGEEGDLGSSAKVYTGSLKMNATGSSIFVDPNYGTGASLFATDKIGDNGSTVSGKVGIGSNSAFGVGFASMAEFEETLSPYLTNNGGFDGEGAVKNALVLNKPVTIADGKGITVASDLKATELDTKVSGNALTLGAGAALIVTEAALDPNGAVAFAAAGGGNVEAADDGSSLVIFAADVTKQDSGKRVFGANTTVDTALKGQAAGGLLDVTFEQNGTITLKNNDKRLGEMRQHISEPTTQLFADYRDGKFAGAVGSLGYKFVYESLTAPGDAYKAVDIAAHAATYAGAQQAAVAAVTTMADAMFGRVGAVGVEAATIAATGSQANGGVWLTPMYKSVDSDGFGAQGGSYGADVDLSGVAFGTDTVNGNMRFGAVFNIGSGDTEGKGLGNGLKDEFDYYGFGIYSAMGFGNFALVGDASMTVISHEVEGLGLKGKADTTAVTMGLTGQYTVATPMVDVTPHLGARFIRLNTDSYDLVSADGVLATTDFDVQNVFSVPLGVTLSKAFVAGGWTLAPSADLTIAFNTGDTEAKSSNQFTGIKAYEYSTEVLDEVQYGLTVGLGAQYGAFGTSFGINYTGSDNTDAFGVNAQCRYMF